MKIRWYREGDAGAVVRLSAACARAEADFVLNPMWESEAEFRAEFARHGIDPEDHLLVADAGEGEVIGMSGFLRTFGADAAGIFCPVVDRSRRSQGVGGELLRETLARGSDQLGIRLATAGIGTRNRGGYALLTALGFRPVRQHFLMRCAERPKVGRLPEKIEVGPAEASDLAEVHAIYRECGFDPRTPEAFTGFFEDDRHGYAVARRDGKVVAFTEIETHWPTRIWVAYVGVSAELRDRGVGSGLMSWAVAQAFDRGAEQALLLLAPANRTAVRAYEKAGFRRARIFDVLEKSL